mmetsp:Transcript_41340/g.39807  ORF Transcript_41340/g.39807 Transcript_41340/m.39807 type:complete len:101 (-) Transcript_41340:358-660(-)
MLPVVARLPGSTLHSLVVYDRTVLAAFTLAPPRVAHIEPVEDFRSLFFFDDLLELERYLLGSKLPLIRSLFSWPRDAPGVLFRALAPRLMLSGVHIQERN